MRKMLDTFNLGKFYDSPTGQPGGQGQKGRTRQPDTDEIRLTDDMIDALPTFNRSFFTGPNDMKRIHEMAREIKGLRMNFRLLEETPMPELHDVGYRIRVKEIIQEMQSLDIVHLIRRRFGNAAGRVFQVLQ